MPHSRMARVIDWLRAGYPQGVPQGDYVALFGVLSRSLTNEEIEHIAYELATSGKVKVTSSRIRAAIRQYSLMTPQPDDVRRVSDRLAEGGWALHPVPQGQDERA